jgi:hypothetical protein
MRPVTLTCAFIAVVALATAACSSPTTTSPSLAPTFTNVYAQIFPVETKAQCSFCHSLPPNAKSNGSLSTGTDKASAYKALVGPATTTACSATKPYVVAGNADESLLFLKLTSPPCGGRMPLGGDALTADQLDLVRRWIAAGAQDD